MSLAPEIWFNIIFGEGLVATVSLFAAPGPLDPAVFSLLIVNMILVDSVNLQYLTLKNCAQHDHEGSVQVVPGSLFGKCIKMIASMSLAGFVSSQLRTCTSSRIGVSSVHG
jgi:hypothetical protein